MSDHLPPPPPGQPGHWEHGPGDPMPPHPSGTGRRSAVLAGGGLLLAGALVAGGIVGYNLLSDDGSELLQGDQPSLALPAGTLAYASVDLDPDGKQKVQAIRTLRQFPGFTDEVAIDEGDDVRARLFQLAQDEDDWCMELDFAEDVDPWLGDRFAVAAIDGGDDQPFPAGVVQVEGEEQARAGLEKMQACAGQSDEPEDTEDFGLAFVDDEWAVVTETQDQADRVVSDVADGTLRDDADFQSWTEETGDAGIVHLYAAPALGQVLLDNAEEIFGAGGDLTGSSVPEQEIPEAARKQLEDFAGAAGTVRFADGALEAEFVTSMDTALTGVSLSDAGAEAVGSLPDTTAAAFGFGLAEGWVDVAIDQMEPLFEEEFGMSSDDALAELEQNTGLTKEDIESLGGESIALAVDADIDPAAFMRMPDPAQLPIGLKIKGDTGKIESALDKLRESGGPEAEQMLLSRTTGDYVVLAMNEDYLDKLAGEDGLGDEDVYETVVGAEDPVMVFFLSFDAGDNWLDDLVADLGAPEEVRENLEPLSGAGISSWVEEDIAHTLVKITVD